MCLSSDIYAYVCHVYVGVHRFELPCYTFHGGISSISLDLGKYVIIVIFAVVALRIIMKFSGGPLSMGDIEELPGSGICVRCPWHHWKVQLKSGQVAERHDISKCAITYPVKVTDDGDIYIGFHHISPSFFNIDRGNCLSFS